MIFDMPTCGGCRTCEMACSFKHEEEFVPSISSIKIIDKKEGPGFLVLLLEETGTDGIACDGCKEFAVPMCMQYCRKSEDLKKILEEFMEKGRSQPERKNNNDSAGEQGDLNMGVNDPIYAYAGKILRVNLSNGKISTEPTSTYAKEWLGASGIAVKILYDELRSWVTPYDPYNKLVFSAGALVGTTAPGACKSNISTLGPMTGGWASSCSDSYVGGQLKYAGYDAIIIEGKAHTPVYLWIRDDKVEIRDALPLWGKTTWETLDGIRKDLGDETLHTVSIGPAGENLVRGACVIQDKGRAFGRCGTGAVMGSKNLKAIVAKGTGAIRVARPKPFMEVVAKARKMFDGIKSVEGMQKYGTLRGLEGKQKICGINFKNFQECTLPEEMMEVVDPCRMIDKYEIARQSFPGCAIGCGRHLRVTEGPYAGLETECNQMEVLHDPSNPAGCSRADLYVEGQRILQPDGS